MVARYASGRSGKAKSELHLLHRNPFLIFHFDALRTKRRDRHNASAEHCAATRLVHIALALLQEARDRSPEPSHRCRSPRLASAPGSRRGCG